MKANKPSGPSNTKFDFSSLPTASLTPLASSPQNFDANSLKSIHFDQTQLVDLPSDKTILSSGAVEEKLPSVRAPQGARSCLDSPPCHPKSPLTKKELWLQSIHQYPYAIFDPAKRSEEAMEKQLTMLSRGVLYSQQYAKKPPSTKFIQSRETELKISPKQKKPSTLFIDLDETLIRTHTLSTEVGTESDILKVEIQIRPFALEFLSQMSQLFTLIIFTAADEVYAQSMVNVLDPEGQFVAGVLSRKHCLVTKNGLFIKDLRVVKDLDLSKSLIVDNLPHSFALQMNNGIPVPSFLGEESDRELEFLSSYLEDLVLQGGDDLVSANRECLRMDTIPEFLKRSE